MINFDEITSVGICDCGAVTVETSDCIGHSCYIKNITACFGFTMNALTEFANDNDIPVNNYCNCNHCANHWGDDICSCGSGKFIGECDCGSKSAYGKYNLNSPHPSIFEKGGLLYGRI